MTIQFLVKVHVAAKNVLSQCGQLCHHPVASLALILSGFLLDRAMQKLWSEGDCMPDGLSLMLKYILSLQHKNIYL